MSFDFKEISSKPDNEQLEKYEKLKELIRSYGKVLVAFSSGVDSAFLLHAAKKAFEEAAEESSISPAGGSECFAAVTAVSRSFPGREYKESVEFCDNLGIKQIFFESDELSIPGFAENGPDRCYVCKKGIFGGFLKIAEDNGFDAVLEGSNTDDMGDYRPGLKAIAELGIKSPLKECGLSKEDIRVLSRWLGLPTWNKQSFACLASRFPYGEKITAEKLLLADKAEQLLLDKGFHQFRVRIHEAGKGFLARIEVLSEEFDMLMEEKTRKEVSEKFREYGFLYVSMDLTGYRTGSLNEALK